MGIRGQRAGLLTILWTAFIGGAVLGTILLPLLTGWILILPALLLFALALLERPRFQTHLRELT